MPQPPLFRTTCGLVLGRSYFFALHGLPPSIELVITAEKVLVNYTKMFNKLTFQLSDIEYITELHTWFRHGILLHHTVEKYPKFVYLFFSNKWDFNGAKQTFFQVDIELKRP